MTARNQEAHFRSQVRRASEYAAALLAGLGPVYEPIPVRIALRNHSLAELHAQRPLAMRTIRPLAR